MYEFWYDYVKIKYGQKEKLWHMDTDRLVECIKTNNIYKDISEDIIKRFDTSKYQKKKNQKDDCLNEKIRK